MVKTHNKPFPSFVNQQTNKLLLTTDETANWKSYNGLDGGFTFSFTFKYPPNWFPKSPTGNSVYFFLNGTKPIVGKGEGDVESNYLFDVNISYDPRTLEQIKSENYSTGLT